MSASTSAPIIELKGITKHFRRKPTLAERILMATGRGKAPPVLRAVDGIDLSVKRGEVLAIAGVQGNGQTELTEAIVGVQTAVQGSVKLQTARATVAIQKWMHPRQPMVGAGGRHEERLQPLRAAIDVICTCQELGDSRGRRGLVPIDGHRHLAPAAGRNLQPVLCLAVCFAEPLVQKLMGFSQGFACEGLRL